MEIKIGKSSRQCRLCEAPFVHEQPLMSLVRRTTEGLLREDYCQPCWKPAVGAGAFSVWTCRFYDSAVAESEPPEAHSPLRRAFYEAVESEERAELAKAYLAAQLLRRQKAFRLIKESDETDGETRIALYTDKHEDRLIEVRDPNLSYAELEAGRVALLERLTELEAGDTDEPPTDKEAGGENIDGEATEPHSQTASPNTEQRDAQLQEI